MSQLDMPAFVMLIQLFLLLSKLQNDMNFQIFLILR